MHRAPSSQYTRAGCAQTAQQRSVRVPRAPPTPAGKLAHREFCAYPSSPGSRAQASTSAASLSLLYFPIKYVPFLEPDKCSEKKPRSLHTAHTSCDIVQHTERNLFWQVHHQKVSTLSLGKTRDLSLLLSNCLCSGSISPPALETNHCNHSPASNGVKQNKNTAFGERGPC